MPYPPSEDTYLTLEALKNVHGNICVDVGTGSCILARELAERCRHTIAIDIDMEACRNCGSIDVICGDGAAALKTADVLVSNLPYLPPEEPLAVDLHDVGLASKVLRWISSNRPQTAVVTFSSLGRVDYLLEALRAICRIVELRQLHMFFESIYVVTANC